MNKKLKVINILEDARVGGPQLRVVSIAKKISDKIETTVVVPKYNSHRFKEMCVHTGVRCKIIDVSGLSRDYKKLFKYFIFFIYEV